MAANSSYATFEEWWHEMAFDREDELEGRPRRVAEVAFAAGLKLGRQAARIQIGPPLDLINTAAPMPAFHTEFACTCGYRGLTPCANHGGKT